MVVQSFALVKTTLTKISAAVLTTVEVMTIKATILVKVAC